jgi:hypothetical protein
MILSIIGLIENIKEETNISRKCPALQMIQTNDFVNSTNIKGFYDQFS